MLQIQRAFVLVVMIFAAIVVAEEPDVVPVASEPAHHKVLENDFVCVFDVTVAPHASTLMHRHDRDYIFITLGDSEISNNRMNEKPVHLVLKDGDMRFAKGGFAHVAQNLADTPFHNLTIELKNPGAPVCGIDPKEACTSSDPSGTIRNMLATEHVQVSLTTLDPGQQTPEHVHAHPHLAAALDDLTFENHQAGKPAKDFTMKKGELLWVDQSGISHYFKNTGKTRGRIVVLEFP